MNQTVTPWRAAPWLFGLLALAALILVVLRVGELARLRSSHAARSPSGCCSRSLCSSQPMYALRPCGGALLPAPALRTHCGP